MTSKSLFFKLMKENMKRRLWSVLLLMLGFFFSLPVALTMVLSEIRHYSGGVDISVIKMQEALNWLEISNNPIPFMVMISAVICGLSSFSYLHSKKQVDFFHSIPVKREKLFGIHYANGILIFAVPYLINMILAIIVVIANGVMSTTVLSTVFIAFLGNLTFYILMYSIVIVAVMLTGNLFISILGTGVFYFYPSCIYILIDMLFGSYFKNYYSDYRILVNFTQKTSPFFAYINLLESSMKGISIAVYLACLIVISLILMLLSLFLYKIRPSEAAGKAMAFPKTKSIIKILLVIPISIACGFLFSHSGYGVFWTIFGLVCGCIISHGTIEIMYNFDFKAILSKKRQLALCGFIATAVIVCFQFDLFGYDTYIPPQDQISSMSIRFNNLDNWVEYWEISEENGFITTNYNTLEVFDKMQLKDTSEAYKLAQKAIEITQTKLGTEVEAIDYNQHSQVFVQYRLKNGKTVRRSYYIPLSDVYEELKVLYKTPEYKQVVFPILTMEESQLLSVTYEERGQKYILDWEQDDMNNLLTAYQEELTNLSLEDRNEGDIIGTIQFMDKNTASMLDTLKRENKDDYDNSYYYSMLEESQFYPLYSSFHNTIALIESQGLEVNKEIDIQDILRIEVTDYSGYTKDGYITKIYSDKEEIREILNNSAYYPEGYRRFMPVDYTYEAVVYMGQGANIRNNNVFIIKEGQEPNFIKTDFSINNNR